jgi:hypothetical protein
MEVILAFLDLCVCVYGDRGNEGMSECKQERG